MYFAHQYWFTDEVQNGSGIPSLTIMFTGVPVGLFLIFKDTVDKAEVGYLIPIGGMIGIFIITYFYHSYLKDSKLEHEGKETYGIVTFNGYVNRGKSGGGEEVKYSYKVNGKTYKKYASNGKYIIDNNIQVGDTITIIYWRSNPHYHDYRVK